jgi:hypothetical protein
LDGRCNLGASLGGLFGCRAPRVDVTLKLLGGSE